MIKKLQALIDEWEEDKKDENDEIRKSMQEHSIDPTKKEIEKIKAIMAKEAIEKEKLLNGECKDYQNPCE
jgi:hypothetical protein